MRIDAEFFAKMPPENSDFRWVPIGQLVSSQYGISIEMNEEGVGFPIYRMNEIESMLCLEDISKCADIPPCEAAPFVLQDRDVLFNRTNSQAFVGRTGLFRSFDADPRIFASYLVRLVPNSHEILPEYLVAFLNSERGVRDIKRRARISINQSNVNPEEVKAIRIPLVSRRFQDCIKGMFDQAHELIRAGKHHHVTAEQTLLRELGLESWKPPEPLTYIRCASEAFAVARLDAEYFAPRVEQLLAQLRADKLTVGDVAPVRQDSFNPSKQKGDTFSYIEISGLRGDGTCKAEITRLDEAPSRATQFVHQGDVVTSTVRPIRRLSGLIMPEQHLNVCSSGFVVLQPKAISPEVLLTYLRLPIICELMDLHTSASLYPAISERDLLLLPIPKISKEVSQKIVTQVRQAHHSRQEAQALLTKAKRAVEVAIDEGEQAAIYYLSDDPGAGSTLMKGGALLLGSLLWESSKKEDFIDGSDREKWRKERLHMDSIISVNNLPLRYGRKSNNRNGQFTMTFRPEGNPSLGTARFAPFKARISVEKDTLSSVGISAFTAEVHALAWAEGICGVKNPKHISGNDGSLAQVPWGFVALWVNTDSPKAAMLTELWKERFTFSGSNLATFGKAVVDANGIIQLRWPNDLKEFDFCLCTLTRPNVEMWTSEIVAEASLGREYFNQTYAIGIRTGDDKAIQAAVKRLKAQ